VSNHVLAPLLAYRKKPLSLRNLRSMLKCLPTFTSTSHDSLIFGVARHLANTLGIIISNRSPKSVVDKPLLDVEYQQLWRKATFLCKCKKSVHSNYNVRSFCTLCAYLVVRQNMTLAHTCPGCLVNDCWEFIGIPCLSCQFVSIVFQNPYVFRLEILINTWLPTSSEMDLYNLDTSSDDESMRGNNGIIQSMAETPHVQNSHGTSCIKDDQELF